MGLEFEGQSNYSPNFAASATKNIPAMAKLLIRIDLAKNAKDAMMILYAVFVLCLLMTIGILMYVRVSSIPKSPLSPEEQERQNQEYINGMRGIQ